MEPGRSNWRLSSTKKMSHSASSFAMFQRPPPHVMAICRSKSTSNNTISGAKSSGQKACQQLFANSGQRNGTAASKTSLNGGNPNTVEAELRRRKEKKEEKERIGKLKREYKAELSRSKRAKYSTASLSAHGVLRDLKNSASRGMSSMKHSFENLVSQKLKLSSPKDGSGSYNQINYAELENEPRTPVRMYSPFGIDSPCPPTAQNVSKIGFKQQQQKQMMPLEKKRGFRFLDKNRVHQRPESSLSSNVMFASPTGKIKEDIKSVTNSLNELSMISQDIQYKFSIYESSSCFSISTQ